MHVSCCMTSDWLTVVTRLMFVLMHPALRTHVLRQQPCTCAWVCWGQRLLGLIAQQNKVFRSRGAGLCSCDPQRLHLWVLAAAAATGRTVGAEMRPVHRWLCSCCMDAAREGSCSAAAAHACERGYAGCAPIRHACAGDWAPSALFSCTSGLLHICVHLSPSHHGCCFSCVGGFWP